MKIKYFALFFLFFILIFFSCLSREENVFIPVPDEKYFVHDDAIGININDIIQTKDGGLSMPDWLSVIINGGIEAAENSYRFNGKYVFIVKNEGDNFTALSRWAESYSSALDFPMLAAARIERRMIKSASLYPDDEYGRFFEKLVKGSYNADYPGAIKEEIYWIKMKTGNDAGELPINPADENYVFLILLSIDRLLLQDIVNDLIEQASESAATRAQTAAINNLKQNFFSGF